MANPTSVAPCWHITAPDGRQHLTRANTANQALERAVIALGYSPTVINDEDWTIVPQEKLP